MKMAGGILKGDEAIGGRRKLRSDTQILVARLFFFFTTLANLHHLFFSSTPVGWFICISCVKLSPCSECCMLSSG
jgi:hypothetical protein